MLEKCLISELLMMLVEASVGYFKQYCNANISIGGYTLFIEMENPDGYIFL